MASLDNVLHKFNDEQLEWFQNLEFEDTDIITEEIIDSTHSVFPNFFDQPIEGISYGELLAIVAQHFENLPEVNTDEANTPDNIEPVFDLNVPASDSSDVFYDPLLKIEPTEPNDEVPVEPEVFYDDQQPSEGEAVDLVASGEPELVDEPVDVVDEPEPADNEPEVIDEAEPVDDEPEVIDGPVDVTDEPEVIDETELVDEPVDVVDEPEPADNEPEVIDEAEPVDDGPEIVDDEPEVIDEPVDVTDEPEVIGEIGPVDVVDEHEVADEPQDIAEPEVIDELQVVDDEPETVDIVDEPVDVVDEPEVIDEPEVVDDEPHDIADEPEVINLVDEPEEVAEEPEQIDETITETVTQAEIVPMVTEDIDLGNAGTLPDDLDSFFDEVDNEIMQLDPELQYMALAAETLQVALEGSGVSDIETPVDQEPTTTPETNLGNTDSGNAGEPPIDDNVEPKKGSRSLLWKVAAGLGIVGLGGAALYFYKNKGQE
eukprot:TRINITY_DN2938_c0_g1_i6.p1 TRINITY_DN2938_c0_g1~~TRINITY_DN2938_c0_g1_i6.p1  ORF type:complete len:494 (+),score=235.12 TRINITY_DN2938_c0_g1_i6:27-1484(+)